MRTLRTLIWVVAFVGGCSRSDSTARAGGREPTQLRFQINPGQVSLAELAADLGYLAPLKLLSVGTTFSGPADIQAVATGDVDIGGAFNGAIIKAIAAGAPIKAVVGYYGVDDETFTGFYVLEGSSIKTARDLLGKKVALNTLGAHGEFIVREYLRRKGLTADEIRQVELIVLPPVNTEQALRAGQVDVGMLGNMLRDKALEHGGLRALFTDVELYGRFTAGSYVLRNAFVQEHPETARRFVEAVSKAIEWERTTPREHVVERQLAIAKRRANRQDADSVRYWRTPGIAGRGGLLADQEFSMWIDWLQKDGVLRPWAAGAPQRVHECVQPLPCALRDDGCP
ncbi:MAG TPA: ABC transporter substrate-binding protein [Polyangiales bacterium]